MDPYKRLEDLYLAGGVQRYHIHRVNVRQTVAEHSWGVATIIALLHPNPRPELLKTALFHDLAEYSTGDVPYHVKRDSSILKKLLTDKEAEFNSRYKLHQGITSEEWQWLKAADMLELVMYCIQEERMGNRNLVEVLQTGCDVILKSEGFPEEIKEYVRQLEVHNV